MTETRASPRPTGCMPGAMPEETIRAFQDHGRVANTLEQGLREARQLLANLEQLGIVYDDVVKTVEREGVEKFTQSFAQLPETTEEKRLKVTTV
jgi:transaldolase